MAQALDVRNERATRATHSPGTEPSDLPVAKRLSTLDRFLPLWIFGAMALGLLLGRVNPGLGAVLDRVQVAGVSVPIGIGLLWLSALVTLYTGWDYLVAGLRYMIEE